MNEICCEKKHLGKGGMWAVLSLDSFQIRVVPETSESQSQEGRHFWCFVCCPAPGTGPAHSRHSASICQMNESGCQVTDLARVLLKWAVLQGSSVHE